MVLPATGHTWTEGGLVPYCTVCNYGRSDGDPIFWSLRNTNLISTVEESYSYVYNGSKLTQMTKGNDTLLFVYDASGRPSELRYNGYYYHYVTNLQGDVTAILDEYGVVVVGYSYDAWGNILTVTGSMAATLGKLNPLTYRGYVYDWETGLYYLQSRYYNPERGRFINSDVFASTGQSFTGNNMFVYCGNNPVSRIDESGELWGLATLVAGAVAAVISGVANAVSTAMNGGSVEDCVVAGLVGAAGGAVGFITGYTVFACTGNALAANAAGRAASTLISDIGTPWCINGEVTGQDMINTGVDLTMDLCLSTVGYYYTEPITNTILNTAANAGIDLVVDVSETYLYSDISTTSSVTVNSTSACRGIGGITWEPRRNVDFCY